MKRLIAKRRDRRAVRAHRRWYVHGCGLGIHLTEIGRSMLFGLLTGRRWVWAPGGYWPLKLLDQRRAYPQVRTRGRFARYEDTPAFREWDDDIPF